MAPPPVQLKPVATSRGTVTVRYLRRDDGELLIDLVTRLSSQSRYHRFHTPVSYVSRAELEAQLPPYLDVDDRNHIALVAVVDEPGRGETAISVARFRRLETGDEAEVAVVVRDDWQRSGLGTAITLQLIEVARSVGIRRFVAWVQGDNRGALLLTARLPYRVEHQLQRGEFTIVVHLDEPRPV